MIAEEKERTAADPMLGATDLSKHHHRPADSNSLHLHGTGTIIDLDHPTEQQLLEPNHEVEVPTQ